MTTGGNGEVVASNNIVSNNGTGFMHNPSGPIFTLKNNVVKDNGLNIDGGGTVQPFFD